MRKIKVLYVLASILLLAACGSSTEKQPKTSKEDVSTEKVTNNQNEGDMVILCPYCLGKISEETTICPHCDLDTRNDAAFEETEDDYQNMEMKTCVHCSQSIPKLATVCMHCKKKQ